MVKQDYSHLCTNYKSCTGHSLARTEWADELSSDYAQFQYPCNILPSWSELEQSSSYLSSGRINIPKINNKGTFWKYILVDSYYLNNLKSAFHFYTHPYPRLGKSEDFRAVMLHTCILHVCV